MGKGKTEGQAVNLNKDERRKKHYIIKKENTTSTARIALWYVVGNVFAKGMAMLSTPVFTRLMSKSEYGMFSTFTSWENIIVILVTLDLSTSIARAKYDFDERMDEYISSILLLSNIVTLCVYSFIEIFPQYFEKLFSMDIIYIRMLFIYLLFSPAFTFLQFKHRIYRKYKFFVAISISAAIIQTSVSVLLVLVLEDKLLGRICGYLIPVTFLNFGLWLVAIAKGRKLSWECIKYACRISIPLIPHSLAAIALGNSDRIMITYYCGSEKNALYSLAYTISMLANLLWTSMNQAWAPWLYDNMDIGNKKGINKNSKLYLGFFTLIVIGILLVAPEIVWVLGGSAYQSVVYAIPPVILGCAFQFAYGMYVNVEIFAKRTFVISLGTVSAAVLNLFLNALFIPKYGYIAAAYTTMAGYFALFVFHYFIVKIMLKQYSDIYDQKFICLVLFGMIAVGGVSLQLYQYNYIRYFLIALYLTVMLRGIYKYRTELKRLLGM